MDPWLRKTRSKGKPFFYLIYSHLILPLEGADVSGEAPQSVEHEGVELLEVLYVGYLAGHPRLVQVKLLEAQVLREGGRENPTLRRV